MIDCFNEKRVARPGRRSIWSFPNMHPINTPIRCLGMKVRLRRMFVNFGKHAVFPRVPGLPQGTKSVHVLLGKIDLCRR